MDIKRHHFPIPFGWYAVAYGDEVGPGSVRTAHYFAQDLVIYRTEDGRACVSEAHCPHLGAHLGRGGKVCGENIICPFHGWGFNADGEVCDVPYAKQLPVKARGKSSLFQYPVHESDGIIWVWYHPQRCAPLFDMQEHPQLHDGSWQSGQLRFEWTINTTLQEVAENAADSAHFIYVHGHQQLPEGRVEHVDHKRSALYKTGVANKPSINLLTASNGPGHTWQQFSGLFDNFLLGLVTPIDHDHLQLRFAFVMKQVQTEEQQMMVEGFAKVVCHQVEQDIPIWNHKTFRPEPLLCDGDGPIAQFRKWFRQFYTQADIETALQQAQEMGVPTLPVHAS